jgi:NAD(P)-dependent dehydrogenase (short-subunit alcohol dehydrogenase family)
MEERAVGPGGYPKEYVDPLELAKPEEIAAAILFLASNESSFITGAVRDIDGGRLAHLGGHSA